ncbi:hypothetical protein, partial [Frankia sp. KB5]|uniref:hypothetical protein n=1 Tax=Frankia sp. KB5 TaxID=683318 RepID=UPI000A223E52
MTIHPTALADQAAAASTEARRTLRRLAATGHARLTVTPSPWLAEQTTTLTARLLTGPVRSCPHIGVSPRMVHAAVWTPGLLACPACVHLLTPTPDEDHRCDRCRRPARPLHLGTAAIGPILLAYGLCTPCQHAAGLAP